MKKISHLLFAIFCFINMYAQEKAAVELKFNHMALSVKDLQRSADFYGNILGLKEITNRTKMDGIKWFSFGESKELHLISILTGEVKINKAVHFALMTLEFDEFVQHLSTAHIIYSNWEGKLNTVTTRADGIKQVYLQDPDGYWIEVNSAGTK